MTNSNNKDFLVTTISGKSIPRKLCRFIDGKYYETNVDCFLMDDERWHRINNGKIAFDNECKRWVLLDRVSLYEGIIGLDENKSAKYGSFSLNPAKNVVVNGVMCMSDEIPEQLEYVEEISTGAFYPKGKLSPDRLNKKAIGQRYSFDLSYSASSKIGQFKESYDKYYKLRDNYSIKPRFASELGSASYGFEIESDNGYIPERLCFRNGLIPLRDGSLRHDDVEPFEFTTIPLSGEKGLYTMIDIAELIQKYTTISKRCSLHLHIGGYKQSKEYVVAMHRVMLRIQDELYSMFPSNYRFTSENGFKQKDYCAPIKNIRLLKSNSIEDNFNALYNYYSGGNGYFEGFGEKNHPLDRDNRAKWNIVQRYYLQNCIPFIWGKSGTYEWRIHTITQNPHKILNWLFICNAVMAYVGKYKDEIANFSDLRSVNLSTIFSDVYSSELATILSGYIQWRKDYMVDMDPQGDKELAEDLIVPPYSVLG